MILVDSSVWIDFLRGTQTWQTHKLTTLLGTELLGIGDLVFAEVLQGCRTQREFNQVRQLLGRLELIVLGGADIVVPAAQNYRTLRSHGITPRGTVDVVQASRCILDGHKLLHDDADFPPFEKHLGLMCVSSEG